jgi:hypothetical protein
MSIVFVMMVLSFPLSDSRLMSASETDAILDHIYGRNRANPLPIDDIDSGSDDHESSRRDAPSAIATAPVAKTTSVGNSKNACARNKVGDKCNRSEPATFPARSLALEKICVDLKAQLEEEKTENAELKEQVRRLKIAVLGLMGEDLTAEIQVL